MAFIVSDKTGSFLFKNLRPGKYRLLITFEGYRHIRKEFTIDATTRDIDYKALYMLHASDLMQEVIVQRPPVTINKDTIEYNAGMFATKPNALAEDLLKMPGIEVDATGKIAAQGETVNRCM